MVWFFKKLYDRRKRHFLNGLAELENQAFQRTAKFIEMEGIVILVKLDEM